MGRLTWLGRSVAWQKIAYRPRVPSSIHSESVNPGKRTILAYCKQFPRQSVKSLALSKLWRGLKRKPIPQLHHLRAKRAHRGLSPRARRPSGRHNLLVFASIQSLLRGLRFSIQILPRKRSKRKSHRSLRSKTNLPAPAPALPTWRTSTKGGETLITRP